MKKTFHNHTEPVFDAESGSVEILERRNHVQRFFDSFKTNSMANPNIPAEERGAQALHIMELSQAKLSKRHMFVLSATSCIATGFFVGSGNVLKQSGPAGLLVGAGIMGICLIATMFSVGELAVRYPTVSPYFELPERFMDISWGFAVGWLHALAYLIAAPLEIITCAMLTQYWKGDDNSAARVNPVAWVALFYAFILAIQLAGNRGFGEFEFLVGMIKLATFIGFIIFAVVILCGGGPTHTYIGGSNWDHPKYTLDGSYSRGFANGFKGTIISLANWPFTYGGMEISATAASESSNPELAICKVAKRAVWRIVVFFLIALTLASLIVPYGYPELGSSSDGSGAIFIIAIKIAAVKGLPSVVNVVMILSILSMSNTNLYGASRTLVALAAKRAGPSFLLYVDRKGRPLFANVTVLLFTAIAFVCASNKYNDVFNWMYAFVSLAYLFVWISICLCYLIIHYYMRKEGISTKELIFKSPIGIPGAMIGAGIGIFTLSLQLWVFIWPLQYNSISPGDRVETFFQNELSIICVLAIWAGHKAYTRGRLINPKNLDVTVGVRAVSWEKTRAAEESRKGSRNFIMRIGRILC